MKTRNLPITRAALTVPGASRFVHKAIHSRSFGVGGDRGDLRPFFRPVGKSKPPGEFESLLKRSQGGLAARPALNVRKKFRALALQSMAVLLLATGGRVASSFAAVIPESGPVKAEIIGTNGGYQLFVDHKPFYIKGAGMGLGSQEKLVEHGGNSLRTWQTDGGKISADQVLSRARKNGLYVTMGLAVGSERHGFDYDDKAMVARQYEEIKTQVLKHKDSPALIIWAIGNELNLEGKNPRVWNAVNDISRMIHQVDPNHLTTTPLAGFKKEIVQEVNARAPDLDLLSFQMYADIVNLPRYLKDSGFNGPYMVTEWGATGHWECGKTGWGAPIENDSTTKAELYRKRFEKVIKADQTRCIGSYVFLWGQKQERTPTWYGMFLDSGEETAAVDTMQYLWTDSWPAIRSPRLDGASLNGKTAYQNIHLKPGESYPAKVSAIPQGADSLAYTWEVLEESRDLKTGGDSESKPRKITGLVSPKENGEIVLEAPSQPGAYRLFAYVFDGKGHAAHVNIPFFVDDVSSSAMIHSPAPRLVVPTE